MSESRNSESRYVSSYSSYSKGESHCSESHEPSFIAPNNTKKNSTQPLYNNLDSIDELIKRLESEIPKNPFTSKKVNEAYEERKEKIDELRALKKQALEEQERKRRIEKEEEMLPTIKKGNKELDEAIAKVKQMVKKTNPTVYTPTSSIYDDGESHSSESRW